jgi:26S proteasome regulatory subunit N10
MSQTNDIGLINQSIQNCSIQGDGMFVTGVKVAQLSLKHRKEKIATQRIICFVGHPIEDEAEVLVDLGRRLKRNKCAIDIINFANPDNMPKLNGLIEAATDDGNSRILDVPLGVQSLTEMLFSSPIMMGDNNGGGAPVDNGAAGAGAAGIGGANPADRFAEWGGMDPNTDPELAMILKVSLEEERARQ